MTPKQKSNELIRINSLLILTQVGNKLNMNEVKKIAEQFALIAVDLILIDCGGNNWEGDSLADGKNYWKEVKKEIEKL
jgi:hypothetical protein